MNWLAVITGLTVFFFGVSVVLLLFLRFAPPRLIARKVWFIIKEYNPVVNHPAIAPNYLNDFGKILLRRVWIAFAFGCLAMFLTFLLRKLYG